jgi:chromosome segregation ATPase
VLNDELEPRFTKLEFEVSRLREDVASARALAALADRDVAELRTEMRAHHQVLNALRETQLEQGQQIDELRQEMREEIGGLRQEMREEIGGLRQEMHQEIGGLRQEMREEIGGLRQEMREEIGGLRQEIDELSQEMRKGFAMQSTGMAQITALLTTIAGPAGGFLKN